MLALLGGVRAKCRDVKRKPSGTISTSFRKVESHRQHPLPRKFQIRVSAATVY